jgi:hypothetical protein
VPPSKGSTRTFQTQSTRGRDLAELAAKRFNSSKLINIKNGKSKSHKEVSVFGEIIII